MRINNIATIILCHVFILVASLLVSENSASAYVKGQCSNCHTMHNSQENAVVVSGTALGDPANDNLLVSDCVGCHTNDVDAQPIYQLGGYDVPAVLNTSAPASMLDGGNFYYTAGPNQGKLPNLIDEGKGHNVAGVSPSFDGTLSIAPGAAGAGCDNSCHSSLWKLNGNPTPEDQIADTGCKGCHLKVGHHVRTSAQGGPQYGAGDAYRFLGGHGSTVGVVPNGDDGNFEDPDWGATPSGFSIYKAQDDSVNAEKLPYISIGRWCAGCHNDFHAFGADDDMFGPQSKNGGDRQMRPPSDPNPGNNPWLRHPTNVELPGYGVDYDWVALGATAYDPAIPVARGTTNRGNIWIDDQVMCLSCHRAHASQYDNSLRFDYDAVIAHNNSAGDSINGCFFCHRSKDDCSTCP